MSTRPSHPFLKKFGSTVRSLRREQNLSQEDLATEAEIERSYMGAIERGERNLTLLKAYRIAKALHVKVAELFK